MSVLSALSWLHTCAVPYSPGGQRPREGRGPPAHGPRRPEPRVGILFEKHPERLARLCFPVRCSCGDVNAYCLRYLYKVLCD